MSMLRSHWTFFSSAALFALGFLSAACGASVSAAREDGSTGADAAATQDVTPPTPVSCEPGQWCWQWPRPQGNPLSATFVVSARDAWAVGDRGTIVHFDGERWAQVRSPTTVDLRRMWGSGPSDVWAFGLRSRGGVVQSTALIHWDGTRWQTVEHGPLPIIQDLHGTGPDNLWLATTGNGAAALSRWNGRAFVAAPALPDTARAQSICARSATEVWVTASDARNSWPYLLYRWNGERWTLVHRTDLPRGERFNSGVVCPADGVAIVGHFNNFDAGVETYLEIRDGRVVEEALPLMRGTAPELFRTPHGAVYYVNANDAVEWTPDGWQRRFALPGVSTFSLSFDHLPDRSAGFLVQGSPFISALQNSQWIADPATVRDALSIVITESPTRNSDPIAAFGGTTWARPVGDRWTHSSTPVIANGMPLTVRAAWGANIDRLWLVGDAGAIALYDARAQSITPAAIAEPVTDALLAVDGAGAAAWAVGNNGLVLRLNGERWTRPSVPLPLEVDGLRLTSLTLSAVDVLSDNDVMILGDDPLGGRFGTVLFRWDGARWSASLTFGASISRFDRDGRGTVYVLTEGRLEKRPVGGGAPTVLARVSDSVRRMRVRGEDEIELVLSNDEGLRLVTWDADRRELVARTPVLTAVGATDIVPGAANAQGRATYWAVGAAGGVLRYVSAD